MSRLELPVQIQNAYDKQYKNKKEMAKHLKN